MRHATITLFASLNIVVSRVARVVNVQYCHQGFFCLL